MRSNGLESSVHNLLDKIPQDSFSIINVAVWKLKDTRYPPFLAPRQDMKTKQIRLRTTCNCKSVIWILVPKSSNLDFKDKIKSLCTAARTQCNRSICVPTYKSLVG